MLMLMAYHSFKTQILDPLGMDGLLMIDGNGNRSGIGKRVSLTSGNAEVITLQVSGGYDFEIDHDFII